MDSTIQGDLSAAAMKAMDEADRKADEDKAGRAPLECPECGYRLEANSRGALNCPMGDYRYGG